MWEVCIWDDLVGNYQFGFDLGLSLNKGEVGNLRMEKVDQLPDFDRVDVPISRVAEMIPRMFTYIKSNLFLIKNSIKTNKFCRNAIFKKKVQDTNERRRAPTKSNFIYGTKG